MSEQEAKKANDCECDEGKVPNREGKCVMPEVTFSAFVSFR